MLSKFSRIMIKKSCSYTVSVISERLTTNAIHKKNYWFR